MFLSSIFCNYVSYSYLQLLFYFFNSVLLRQLPIVTTCLSFFNLLLLRQLLIVTTSVSFFQSFLITSVTHSYHRFVFFNLCNYISYS